MTKLGYKQTPEHIDRRISSMMSHPGASERRRQTMRETNRTMDRYGEKNPFFGRHHSEKTRRILAKKSAQQYVRGGDFSNTLELALRRFLIEAGFEFEEQVQFDRCVVDAWVPEYGLVFEADGEAWHAYNERQRPGYYRRREWFLKQQSKIIAIIHLTEEDLAPWR